MDDRPYLVHSTGNISVVFPSPTRSSFLDPINLTTPVPVDATAYHAVACPCLVSGGVRGVVLLRFHVLEWCYTYYILLYHYSAVLLSYCGTVIYWLVSVVLSYILFSVLALLVAVRCCPSSLQRIFCTPNVLSNRPAFHRLMLICPHSLTIPTIFTAAGRPVPVLGLGYD